MRFNSSTGSRTTLCGPPRILAGSIRFIGYFDPGAPSARFRAAHSISRSPAAFTVPHPVHAPFAAYQHFVFPSMLAWICDKLYNRLCSERYSPLMRFSSSSRSFPHKPCKPSCKVSLRFLMGSNWLRYSFFSSSRFFISKIKRSYKHLAMFIAPISCYLPPIG